MDSCIRTGTVLLGTDGPAAACPPPARPQNDHPADPMEYDDRCAKRRPFAPNLGTITHAGAGGGGGEGLLDAADDAQIAAGMNASLYM